MTRFILLLSLFAVKSIHYSQSKNYLEGEVMVLLEPNIDVKAFSEELNQENLTFKVNPIQVLSKRMNIWRIGFDHEAISTTDFLSLMDHNPKVQIAQLNHTNISLRDTCPNDTNFASKQWALKNTGQTGGTPGADIDACLAWDYLPSDSVVDTTFYGDEIVVAVIDDGFDLSHPDINYFTNKAEIPGDSIDNDGNGLIDDVQGWNFYSNTNVITTTFHGTHVAGIVGAKGNNTMGVSGVAGGVSILPIQGSSINESFIVQVYDYVITMRDLYDSTDGAKGAFIVVTNASFGVDDADPASYPLWCAMYDSMGTRGILTAAATTNSNSNVDLVGDIPTTCGSPYVIGVTNTTSSDSKANAGYGLNHIDLGAPGALIYSTIPFTYGLSSGTSMAAPHVAGAISFIYAAACSNFIQTYYNSPDSVALLLKNDLLGNVDVIGSLNGITVSGGRLNLYKAVHAVNTYGLCSITSIEEEYKPSVKVYPNPSNGIFNIDFLSDQSQFENLEVYTSSGKLVQKKHLNGNLIKELDLSHYDNGFYVLCFSSYSGERTIYKLMKE